MGITTIFFGDLQSEHVHTRMTEFSGFEYNGDRILPHETHTFKMGNKHSKKNSFIRRVFVNHILSFVDFIQGINTVNLRDRGFYQNN